MVENLSQDDRIDQLGLAASWGVSPLDDSNRWGAALYGVNQSFYQLLRVECLGRKSSFHRERTGHFSDSRQKDRLEDWRPSLFGFVTSMDPTGGGFRWGNDLSGKPAARESWDYRTAIWLRSVGEKQFTITAIVDPGGFDDQNVFAWEPCFTVLEDQIPPDGLWCAYYTVSSLGRELYGLLESIQKWQADLPVDAGGVGTIDLNRQLLLYYGIDYPGSLLLPAFYGLMAVTLLIILVGAVSLARNAFAISMTERTQMLECWPVLGATRAQKRQSVLYEAFILGLIGIPLGLIAGCGGMAITLVFPE